MGFPAAGTPLRAHLFRFVFLPLVFALGLPGILVDAESKPGEAQEKAPRLIAAEKRATTLAKPHPPRNTTIRIGVLANRGAEICLQEWGPTAAYLNDRLDEWIFEIVPLGFEELIPAVRAGEVDLVSANPSYYAYMEYHGLARRIVTLQMPTPSGPQSRFGGVVLTLAEREDIHALTDLREKRFAAVSERSLGGWHAAWRELVEAGVLPECAIREILFKGSHDAVVEAIVAGQVDAGTVRSTQIERMITEGLVDPSKMKIIGSRAADYPYYPYALSTRLYPEWPMAALAGTDARLIKQVALGLMRMDHADEAARALRSAGWTTPEDYTPVRELLKDLRLPPYEHHGRVTLGQFIRQFRGWLLGLGFLALCLLAAYVRSVLLNRRLKLHERILATFFSQSLHGFFICMLDKPIAWNADGADKNALLEYALDHQRMTKVNQAMLDQYGAMETDFLGMTVRELFKHDVEQAKAIWR